jgi:L-iditol 2-dehydrogenase
MKSAKLLNGKVQIIDTKKPELNEEKGAIIKVLGCGLCGSDLVKIKHATIDNEKNIVLGHEVVGLIEEINSNTDFKKGDIVALGHHYPCGNCEFCKNGSTSMCRTFKKSNISPSGFSEYIRVDENHLKYTVYKMSNELKNDEKAFLEPLSCCIRAIRRAGFEYDKDNSKFSALVVGLGSIGLLMLKGLRAFGVKAGGFDIKEERLKRAQKDGFSFNQDKKYDVVFLTAGSSKAIKTALNNVIDGGKIIVFSSVEDDISGFSNNEIYYRELSIISSYSPHPKDLKLSSKLLNTKKVETSALSTYYTLDNLAQAIDDSFNNKIFKAYIEI